MLSMEEEPARRIITDDSLDTRLRGDWRRLTTGSFYSFHEDVTQTLPEYGYPPIAETYLGQALEEAYGYASRHGNPNALEGHYAIDEDAAYVTLRGDNSFEPHRTVKPYLDETVMASESILSMAGKVDEVRIKPHYLQLVYYNTEE